MSPENPVCRKLIHVVAEISKWMSTNLLKLNQDKSEVMFIATRQQLSKFLPGYWITYYLEWN